MDFDQFNSTKYNNDEDNTSYDEYDNHNDVDAEDYTHDEQEHQEQDVDPRKAAFTKDAVIPPAIQEAFAEKLNEALQASTGKVKRKTVKIADQQRKKANVKAAREDTNASTVVYDALQNYFLSGEPIPQKSGKRRNKTLSIGAPEWMWRLIEMMALAGDCSVSDVMEEAIQHHMN